MNRREGSDLSRHDSSQPEPSRRVPGIRALGVDLGSKRVGIAVSDLSGTIASALTTVQRSKSRRHDHAEIAKIASLEECDVVVVGLPLSLDGSRGPAARAATIEARQMASVLAVPVEMYDERFTTVTAERHMMEVGLDARQRRLVVDKAAAAVMLQGWLDHRRGTWNSGPAGAPGDVRPGENRPT